MAYVSKRKRRWRLRKELFSATENPWLVRKTGAGAIELGNPPSALTGEQALTLAAYLVHFADETPDAALFTRALSQVGERLEEE